MLSEAKHLKHTVGLHSVLAFEILRFAQDDIHWNYFSLLNSNLCRNNRYWFVFCLFLFAVSEGRGIRGLDALSKHAGGMFVAKERSNLRLRRGPEALAGSPLNRVGVSRYSISAEMLAINNFPFIGLLSWEGKAKNRYNRLIRCTC